MRVHTKKAFKSAVELRGMDPLANQGGLMPEHFTAEERDRLRARLLVNAERLFTAKGVKATTVADITRASGIAKGSFYTFFQSKEALLAELLNVLERNTRIEFMTQLSAIEQPTDRDFADSLLAFLASSMSQPLLVGLMRDPGFVLSYKKIPEPDKDEMVASDVVFAGEIITLLAGKGLVTDLKPAVVAGLFKTVFLAMTGQDEIGLTVHGEVVERLCRAIAVAVFARRPEDKA